MAVRPGLLVMLTYRREQGSYCNTFTRGVFHSPAHSPLILLRTLWVEAPLTSTLCSSPPQSRVQACSYIPPMGSKLSATWTFAHPPIAALGGQLSAPLSPVVLIVLPNIDLSRGSRRLCTFCWVEVGLRGIRSFFFDNASHSSFCFTWNPGAGYLPTQDRAGQQAAP